MHVSSRHRQSTARPTPSRASVLPGSTPLNDELPPYKKPSHALSTAAQTKLRTLNDRSLDHLKHQSRQSGERLMDAAAMVNDVVRERAEALEKERKKWEQGIDLETQEQDEARLAWLQQQAEECTTKLETSMRAAIDNGVAAQRIEESLNWLRDHAPGQLERDYATQRTQIQSQRASQSQRRRTRSGEEEDDEDDDMENERQTQESVGPTPGPTPLDGSRPSLTGVSELYAERIERKKNDYTSISFGGRYSHNEAYSMFKKIVHDAKYGDDRPLPNPDTWFTEMGSPAPGVTGHGEDHDEDDDIVMERATISIKCPLTFLPFKEPYTSSKCPHTFERNAILELIRKSAQRNANGVRAIGCPVTGCDQVFIRLLLNVSQLNANILADAYG